TDARRQEGLTTLRRGADCRPHSPPRSYSYESSWCCTSPLVNARLFRRVVFSGPSRLTSRGWIDDDFDLVDAIRRKTAQIGVLSNQFLIARDVHAVHLIGSDEALHPLNARSDLFECLARPLGHRRQGVRRQVPCARHVPFDHEFWHDLSFPPGTTQ